MSEGVKKITNVKDKELKITNVTLKMNFVNNTVVDQVRLETDKGYDITYKPSIERVEFRNGMQVMWRDKVLEREVPSVFSEIGLIIAKQRYCMVNVSYNVMTVDNEGEVNKYRFIKGDKMLSRLEVVDAQKLMGNDKEPEEDVE